MSCEPEICPQVSKEIVAYSDCSPHTQAPGWNEGLGAPRPWNSHSPLEKELFQSQFIDAVG